MRKFIVYVVRRDAVIILGLVESQYYPSIIVNDHEYSKKAYGYDYVRVTEVSSRCHIEI